MDGCTVCENEKNAGFSLPGAEWFTSGTAHRRVPNALERPTPENGKTAYLSYFAARSIRSPVGARRNPETKIGKGTAATD